jgi:hypothetical protein
MIYKIMNLKTAPFKGAFFYRAISKIFALSQGLVCGILNSKAKSGGNE